MGCFWTDFPVWLLLFKLIRRLIRAVHFTPLRYYPLKGIRRLARSERARAFRAARKAKRIQAIGPWPNGGRYDA